MATRIHACRVCGSTDLLEILSLGELAVSDFVVNPTDAGTSAPLDLVLCNPHTGCGLLQLGHLGVSADILYQQYWYKSGVNATMKAALKDVAQDIRARVKLRAGDVVADIGANDGTLLSYFPANLTRVGIEPARNLSAELSRYSSVNILEYFTEKTYKNKLGEKQATVMTSLAMFYDLDDPIRFARDVASCLLPEGIWVNQMTSLDDMIATTDFANICHEHVTYYSLHTYTTLLEKAGFKLLDVSHNLVNGGSIRTIAAHQSSSLQPTADACRRIENYLEKERVHKLQNIQTYRDFAKNTRMIRRKIKTKITRLAAKGKTIAVYGASTKGNTLLQYCELSFPTISAALDRNKAKNNRYCIATAIPVFTELSMSPDYLLVLPWHFKDEFIERERAYLEAGGKMIFPLPKLTVITGKSVARTRQKR